MGAPTTPELRPRDLDRAQGASWKSRVEGMGVREALSYSSYSEDGLGSIPGRSQLEGATEKGFARAALRLPGCFLEHLRGCQERPKRLDCLLGIQYILKQRRRCQGRRGHPVHFGRFLDNREDVR